MARRARHIASLCRSPRESVDAYCRSFPESPNLESNFFACFFSLGGKEKRVERNECRPKHPPRAFIRQVAPSASSRSWWIIAKGSSLERDPSVGESFPARQRRREVLPVPEGPVTARKEWQGRVRSRLRQSQRSSTCSPIPDVFNIDVSSIIPAGWGKYESSYNFNSDWRAKASRVTFKC